ncbi:uncharacterized protein LOC135978751 isoform X1 [Chrysemys picta bellii]|uniref:uncharacterized protein LOC135978751 isoform X1 n=1 Tax=Chrysemys picta bellii TaxID=8478 RepID=UPI0032B295CC
MHSKCPGFPPSPGRAEQSERLGGLQKSPGLDSGAAVEEPDPPCILSRQLSPATRSGSTVQGQGPGFVVLGSSATCPARLAQSPTPCSEQQDVFLPRTSPCQLALSVTLAGVVFLSLLASYCIWKQHRAKDTQQAELKKEIHDLQSNLEKEREILRSELENERGKCLGSQEA